MSQEFKTDGGLHGEPPMTMRMSANQRDGNWMDGSGACKVCDGEIPNGHTDACDIYKLECEVRDRFTIDEVMSALSDAFAKSNFRSTQGATVEKHMRDILAHRTHCPFPEENRIGTEEVRRLG